MKKIFSLLLLLAVCVVASAQEYMRIWQDGENIKVPLSEVTFADNGASFTAEGQTYQTSQVDSITFVHIITVTWNGTQANVEKGNVLGVDYTIDGGDVVITSTNTHNELEFVLQGTSTNGSLTYNGTYKCKFYLNGLNLSSQKGAALDILCGKRVDLVLNEGTDQSSEILRKLENRFNCPVVSMLGPIPEALMIYDVDVYPSAIFINKSTFTGAYLSIDNIELFNNAIEMFLTDNSIAYKENN